jgi:hypothetical protein
MLVASHSIHHPDDQQEVEETAEAEEAVYLLQQDPACSHRTDELRILTSF